MFVVKPEFSDPISDWALKNEEAVRAGTAVWNGQVVTADTTLRRFHYVYSFLFGSTISATPFEVETPESPIRVGARLGYSLLSLVMGPWSLPFGIPTTVGAVIRNLSGGERITAGALIHSLRWRVELPGGKEVTGQDRDMVEFGPEAAEEIERRIAAGEFPADIAVRISPTRPMSPDLNVTFDIPYSDGRDWVDESHGRKVLIDKKEADFLSGSQIDFRDGGFFATPGAHKLSTLDREHVDV